MPKSIGKERSFSLLPEGDHVLTIEKATEKVSKSGNPMIEIQYGAEGRSEKIFEFLVFADADWSAEKLTSFQRARGIVVNEGDEIEIEADDLVGQDIEAKVKIQKDKTGAYPDKSVIAFYYDKTKDIKNKVNVNEFGEPDQIPF